MRNKIFAVIIASFIMFGFFNTAFADISLTIRDGDTKVFEGTVPMPPAGTVSLTDTGGNPHDIDNTNVLGFLGSLDATNNDFQISKITDFGFSLYLKCITYSAGEKCDNWQYAVDGTYPDLGMDKTPLTGNETVYLYFGPQNQILLSDDSITINDTLTVTAQAYDYQNNGWTNRSGVTVGLTQPNPNDPFNPTEITTAVANGNGEAVFSSIPDGTYDVGVKESSSFGDFYNSTEMKSLTVAAASHSGGGGGRSYTTTSSDPEVVETIPAKPVFDLNKSLDFLVSQQKENGSFGEDMYTDWVALALASGNNQTPVLKLVKYFGQSKLDNPRLTDYERRAMALMSLGLNPYNSDGENYIGKIVESFDGKQFGDIHEDNDDVFALIVLQNAGYEESDKMVQGGISFVMSAQQSNGSWDNSVDMTGAAIEALSAFSSTPLVEESLAKAENFLKESQKDNGGWNDDASSTAWAIEGILALGEKPADWEKEGNTPTDFLATLSDTDGSIKNDNLMNRIWQTAYAASALSGKTWTETMQKFDKEEPVAEAPKVIAKKIAVKKPAPKIAAAPKPEKAESETTVQNSAGIENTATVINAGLPAANESTPPERGWWSRLLGHIFGF